MALHPGTGGRTGFLSAAVGLRHGRPQSVVGSTDLIFLASWSRLTGACGSGEDVGWLLSRMFRSRGFSRFEETGVDPPHLCPAARFRGISWRGHVHRRCLWRAGRSNIRERGLAWSGIFFVRVDGSARIRALGAGRRGLHHREEALCGVSDVGPARCPRALRDGLIIWVSRFCWG